MTVDMPTGHAREEGMEGEALAGPPAGQGENRMWEKKKKTWADYEVRLDRRKKKFFKRKSFPIFRALEIDQIQMKFEFNFKQSNPTLNQK